MLVEKRLPLRYVVDQAGRETLIVLVIAVLGDLIIREYREHVPPVPLSIPAFLGTAISLILSFKLAQSYDRWWEARKVWGAIVNDSRTLVRQLLSFSSTSSEQVTRMARRQIA